MNAAKKSDLFPGLSTQRPTRGQLLKWIGNKQRFAQELISYFPEKFNNYYEPFLGSGAVLGALAPSSGFAGDAYAPLIEIWSTLKTDPLKVIGWYSERHALIRTMGKKEAYSSVLATFNAAPNGADLLFLSRACYGGVVRFRKADGYMSTPCGIHDPISPESFAGRAIAWHARIEHTEFVAVDYSQLMARAQAGDIVYCDPPYVDSQGILYGAQGFKLPDLFDAIAACKRRGALVALSIDGTKKSGKNTVDISPPADLFMREEVVHVGRSMLRRFQMDGQTLEAEHVSDRLYLTY